MLLFLNVIQLLPLVHSRAMLSTFLVVSLIHSHVMVWMLQSVCSPPFVEIDTLLNPVHHTGIDGITNLMMILFLLKHSLVFFHHKAQ